MHPRSEQRKMQRKQLMSQKTRVSPSVVPYHDVISYLRAVT